MISFKSKADTGASVAILVALAVMLAAAIIQFAPKPTSAAMAKGAERSRDQIKDEIGKLEASNAELTSQVNEKIWSMPLDDIGPKALQTVSGYVQKAHLKLVAFRPQKTVEVNGLTQIPFLISVEGSYPGMMELLRELDLPDAKVATNTVQLTSTDGSSDKVTGTIVAVAYTQQKPKEKPKKTTSDKTNVKPNTKEKPNAKKEN